MLFRVTVLPIQCDAEAEALLLSAGLPVSDLRENPSLELVGLRADGRLVGVVGIERYGNVALLRSLAVDAARRDSGYGHALVGHAERWALERGVRTCYLLTTTAGGFFARLGYKVTSRAEAPAAIAATSQFSGVCPASSTFMRKLLAEGEQHQEVEI